MMNVSHQRKRIADFWSATKLSRRLGDQERWPREQLVSFQQKRLDELVRFAVVHSPYYRERIGSVDGPVELGQLPMLDKAAMMERFDDVVIDRRLRRDDLARHVEELTGDPLYLGRYRVLATSGSSGRKGLFVFDRPDWAAYVAQFLRYSSFVGIRPRLPRLRLAWLGGGSPSSASRRLGATIDFGVHRLMSLPVTLPVPRLVEELNQFQPQFLNAYPSVAVLLAEEQLAGRLRISPTAMSTSSEMLTPQMADRIEHAFGVRPFNAYATTEGLIAVDCEMHSGLHLFEDLTIVENVDEHGRPVPDGEPGTKLLITNLANRAQPLIRYELLDAVTIDSEPCGCGRTLRRFRTVEGRTDDVLRLPGRSGSTVLVHPMQFGVIARDHEVVEFQVIQRGPRLQVLVVARGAARDLEKRIHAAIADRLGELGVTDTVVEVTRRPRLERQASGKLQLVVRESPSCVR